MIKNMNKQNLKRNVATGALLFALLSGGSGVAINEANSDCINDVSVMDCVLGDNHLAEKFNNGGYYVYTRFDSTLDNGRGGQVSIVSSNKNLKSYRLENAEDWKFEGTYVPQTSDRIFLYRCLGADLNFHTLCENYDTRIKFGDTISIGMNTLEYVGILNEENYEKYKHEINYNLNRDLFCDNVFKTRSYASSYVDDFAERLDAGTKRRVMKP